MSKQLLTAKRVAARWMISELTVRKMIASGQLPVIRLGRSVRVRERDVQALERTQAPRGR
jgi:excisionase family DNA binding protein